MKKILCFITLCFAVFAFSSCGVTTKTVANTSSQYEEMPKLKNKDLVYLGEVELAVNYSTYFGFIQPIRTVNGETFDKKKMTCVDLNVRGLDNRFNWAASKVLEAYPDARYFRLSFTTEKKNRMFCGKNVDITAKIRCYDLNEGRGVKACKKESVQTPAQTPAQEAESK